MDRAELENNLESAQALTFLDTKQQQEVDDVLKHPGLRHLYGLMLGSRQAQYALLSRHPLTNMETVAQASVIQGVIKGIELFRDTLLEQTVRAQEQNQEQKV